jgi:hypothetical protein
MAHILYKTKELGPKNYDTQLYVITDKKQDFLLSFNGFMDSDKAPLASSFQVHEVVMFTKGRATKLKAELKKENLRQVEITSSLKQKITDWMMDAEVKLSL